MLDEAVSRSQLAAEPAMLLCRGVEGLRKHFATLAAASAAGGVEGEGGGRGEVEIDFPRHPGRHALDPSPPSGEEGAALPFPPSRSVNAVSRA